MRIAYLSKRHVKLLVLLCVLLGSVLSSHPISANGAPPPTFDKLALDELEHCTAIDNVDSDGFFAGNRSNYVVAALMQNSEFDWMQMPTYSLIMQKAGHRIGIVNLASMLMEGVDIEKKARVFLESDSDVTLLYYDNEGNLKANKYKYNAMTIGTTGNADLILDKTFNITQDKFLDIQNTPIWDIVGNKDGFYTPIGCHQINGPEKIAEDCRKDCYTIDSYCLWDQGIKKHLTHRTSPNLEGGPRSTIYDGYRYQSLFCNTFSRANALKDGKPHSAVLIRNEKKPASPTCFFTGKYTFVQLWSQAWNNATLANLGHCLDFNGKDLGLPGELIEPITEAHTGSQPDECHNNATFWTPIICAIIFDVLMTIAAIIVCVSYRKWNKMAATEYDDDDQEYDE